MISRQTLMGLVARAQPQTLAALCPDMPPCEELRAPEIGTVLLQGRIGGTGAAFPFGEATVTRCALRSGDVIGHGNVMGRDKDHARRAALVDLLWQTAPESLGPLIAALQAAEAARRAETAARAAATRVEFLTLVRGEDA